MHCNSSLSQHDAQLNYYGNRLATASSDHSIKIFEVSPTGDHTPLASLLGHQGPVWQVAWAHPKYGPILASCGYDSKIIVWKEQAPGVWGKLWEDDRHDASVNSIAFAPHSLGLILAAGSSDGNISIWTHQLDNTWACEVIPAHSGGVSSVSWAPALHADPNNSSNNNNNAADAAVPALRLVSGGCDNAVRLWLLAHPHQPPAEGAATRWVEVTSFHEGKQTHGDWVRDVAWAPSLGLTSSCFASCSEDKTVRIWAEDAAGTWRVAKSIAFPQRPWRVSWSLMGDVLAVAQGDNTVSLWHQQADGQWQTVSTLGGTATAAAPAAAQAAAAPVAGAL